MNRPILLCTVGGSHHPILAAIRSQRPRFVCFFCTGPDPESERPGSESQVTGSGKVIYARPGDKNPTLPNIPNQVQLDHSQFEVVEVPADDLDQAFLTMRATIARLGERFPGGRFVADYTGGTKTMTAALVTAVLQSDDVELQLVSGSRPDLSIVTSGTELAMAAPVTRLRVNQAMALYLSAWKRFGYREAATGLDTIRIDAGNPDRQRLGVARTLSHMLALWDDFDHSAALARTEGHKRQVATSLPRALPTLGLLAKHHGSKREAARVFDLWLNAQRRAAQGRFDDAVSRVYRLIEWTAQWQLQTNLGVQTADFPLDKMPQGGKSRPRKDGKNPIGLVLAWEAIGEHIQGPVGDFANHDIREMKNLLQIRNNSILAHGFRPVRLADWLRMESWMKERFIPMLREAAMRVGLREEPIQLPTEPPSSVWLI